MQWLTPNTEMDHPTYWSTKILKKGDNAEWRDDVWETENVYVLSKDTPVYFHLYGYRKEAVVRINTIHVIMKQK